MAREETNTIDDLLKEIISEASSESQKLLNLLEALRTHLNNHETEAQGRAELLQQYEEAYQKLTQPANRLGIYLAKLDDGTALVAVGDSEYVVIIDPQLDQHELALGTRVRLNEAYAIVGAMSPVESGNVQSVSEALPDLRLRIGSDVQGQSGRIIRRADALLDAEIKAGDEVRVDSSYRIALEHFPKSESRDYFLEDVPELPWSKIGGQDHAIQLIRDTIEQPLLYPDIYAQYDKKPIKGILLYGPPGCGKTLLGKATAYNLARDYSKRMGQEVKEYFMHISGPKILNMWLGETERMVREIFNTARERAKEGRLVVVFLDEAEAVLRTRSSGKWLNISNTVVPQFCAELDGIIALENVVLILTSNRPDYIDPAILRPERIDRKVKIGRPDRSASKQIFEIYLHERIPIDPSLLKAHDGEAACARKELIEAATAFLFRTTKETEFLRVHLRSGTTETLHWRDFVSGALLKSVIDRAKDSAIQRAILEPNSDHGLRNEDLIEAIDAEYSENEIFPKADVLDDWLKLIDLEPDRVAAVKPIGSKHSHSLDRSPVV